MKTAAVAVAVAVAVAAVPPPAAHAHTRAELDEWMGQWASEAYAGLTLGLVAEFQDMVARHPWYFVSAHTGHPRRSGMGTNVEQWRHLVEAHFPAEQVAMALCVIRGESGGNPEAKNSSSTAAGLWQFLRATWDWVAGVLGLPSYAEGGPYQPELATRAAAWLWANYGWSQWNAAARC